MTSAHSAPSRRVVVVGAGLSGLTAARRLAGRPDLQVTVFDKGRSPGGRLATRRIAGGVLDHGAQFFTVRGDALAAQVADWEARELVKVWCTGFDDQADGHPRYIAPAGMTSLAKDLAAGLDVRCSHLVFAVRRRGDGGGGGGDRGGDRGGGSGGGDRGGGFGGGGGGFGGWSIVIDDGTIHDADAVVLTCPLPQTFSLLFEVGVELPIKLFNDDYDRTIALLAVLDRPSVVPAPGGLQAHQLAGTAWSFIGDNQSKGVSPVPAVTFHASPEWSEANWDTPVDQVHHQLLEHARPWLGDATVIESQVKRWRFATPRTPWPEPCWVDPTGTLILAGDAFAGPRIEGAFESGLAAARAVPTAF